MRLLRAFTAALLLAGGAGLVPPRASAAARGSGAQTPQTPAQETAAQEASRPAFSDFLAAIRTEALGRGIRQDVLDEALAGIDEPVAVVIERDRTQAEIVQPLEHYLSRHLTARFISHGRQRYADEATLLKEVGDAYGVNPRIIAGIWGMETNFGRFSGVRPTIAVLATLAWDPRRAAFFRGELFNALEILNRGDIDVSHMRGSWAGAMGQVQFMPSSYLDYAADYDGDGRRDIWSTPADIFASIANYLIGHGWEAGEPWGREVSVSAGAARRIANEVPRREGSCHAMRDMTVVEPVAEWRKLGVRALGGGALPALPDAALVSGSRRHFLVDRNYDALLAYNCAHSYALSVGLLADRLGAPAARTTSRTVPAKKTPAGRKRRR
jgi:membrane-bound lytic murein transglycosylase B